MSLELTPCALKDVRGKFYEAELFENLPDSEVEEFNKQFPYMEKLRLPGQWGMKIRPVKEKKRLP